MRLQEVESAVVHVAITKGIYALAIPSASVHRSHFSCPIHLALVKAVGKISHGVEWLQICMKELESSWVKALMVL